MDKTKYWKWHYSPRDITFNDALEEFSNLFEKLVINGVRDKNILLPISGGIDSRSLFVPVKNMTNLILSSYEYDGGFSESETGQRLSEHYNIPLFSQKIQRGYLWNKIYEFHELNSCFTDFTHPRQVDAINNWK